MFSRGISEKEVLGIVKNGRIIIDYPDDKPYPSFLILGFSGDMPIHVVVAINNEERTGIIVTAYVPDTKIWNDDFTSRRLQ